MDIYEGGIAFKTPFYQHPELYFHFHSCYYNYLNQSRSSFRFAAQLYIKGLSRLVQIVNCSIVVICHSLTIVYLYFLLSIQEICVCVQTMTWSIWIPTPLSLQWAPNLTVPYQTSLTTPQAMVACTSLVWTHQWLWDSSARMRWISTALSWDWDG